MTGERKIPAPDEYIDAVFGREGYLSRAFPGYEPRAGQVAFARAVDRSIVEGKHLLAEAPVGCHARGQRILRYSLGRCHPDGGALFDPVAVEDVEVGDLIVGPDGPREVLSLHRGRQTMWRIVPAHGASWVVNEGHVMAIRGASGEDADVSLSFLLSTFRAAPRIKRYEYLYWSLWRCPPNGSQEHVPFAVEGPLPEDDYFGFTLSGDGRYLLDDFTVTHNSGKSVGYSVPATYHAFTQRKQVVIVTANIALQEQIAKKDLPLLQKILPWPFTFALLKGRNNYLCVDQFLKTEALLSKGQSSFAFPADVPQHLRQSKEQINQRAVLTEWANACIVGGVDEETGDASELPFEPEHSVWRDFSTTTDMCKGRQCSRSNDCFSQNARAKAKHVDVVVTNYHLLCAHISLWRDKGFDYILPPFEIVIADECHQLPSIARDFFGFQISEGSIKSLAKKINDDSISGALYTAGGAFFAAMYGLQNDRNRYKASLTLASIGTYEKTLWNGLRDALERAAHMLNAKLEYTGGNTDKKTEIEKLRDRVLVIRHDLAVAMWEIEPDGVVCYLEKSDRGAVSVCSKLVHPGDALKPTLFNKTTAPPPEEDGHTPLGGAPVVVIGASATVATGAGNFDFMIEELGMENPLTMIAESPFDFMKHALFIVPEGLPDPNDKAFPEAVATTCEQLIQMAGGSLLGLFTSRRVLSHVYDSLVPSCRQQNIALMKQGDAPRTTLVEKFRADESSVLLGTSSLWAGVDVPGDALRVVVIDRLPFPMPDDPIVDALQRTSDKVFWTYSVPRSITELKQGAGRLIRSARCHGVIVCCDNRIITKKYGKSFLKALPPMPKSTRLLDAYDWLNPKAPASSWDEL